jgi:hypothetical protein
MVLALAGAAALLLACLYAMHVRWPRGVNTPEARTRHEIVMLETAVEVFRAVFRGYPPSRIRLSETGRYRKGEPLDEDSRAFLERCWPKIDWANGIDWNGNGKVDPPEGGGDVVLEGDQCLVFFLGGIPKRQGEAFDLQGFSADPDDPARPGGQRHGPFFDFRPHWLAAPRGGPFPSYLDPHGRQPFAYFSSYGRRNGYNPYGGTDCPTLGVWPYAASLGPAPAYHNPASCQILSAGADGRFGPGTVLPGGRTWMPESAGETPPEGRDDQSNFHDGLLGEP